MSIVGHLIALLGLYGLYNGELIIGAIVFFLGGFLASKLFFCLRSCGVIMLVTSIAYGFHNEYTPLVFFLILVGFVLACFNTKRTSRNQDNGWGFDIDLSPSRSGSNCREGTNKSYGRSGSQPIG